jgi:hypothetical protein
VVKKMICNSLAARWKNRGQNRVKKKTENGSIIGCHFSSRENLPPTLLSHTLAKQDKLGLKHRKWVYHRIQLLIRENLPSTPQPNVGKTGQNWVKE